MLKAEGVGKRYGSRWLFRRLEFDLRAGDSLLVTGPNGSGKSTLLKGICGLVSLSEGKVQLPEGDPRLSLGYSSLDLALYPLLTAAEHLELSAKLRGCVARTAALLNRVGLTAPANQRTAEFSTGMRARLKLALAIQAEPQVLLLDEPGASLDEHGRALVDAIVAEQMQRGACVIASNDPLERRLATHALALV